MPKSRKTSKRKAPVTSLHYNSISHARSSNTSTATRTIIRRFHVLNKRKTQLEKLLEDHEGCSNDIKKANSEIKAIEEELAELGGLEEYQRMSVIGQGNDRGGGSEKVLISFLNELGYPRLLEGGHWKYVHPSFSFLLCHVS